MCQRPAPDKASNRHSDNEPEKRGVRVIRIVRYSVEAARVCLILDDELLKYQGLPQSDHRAIDAVDVPLEGNDTKQKGEQRRHDQRARDGKWNRGAP